MAIKLLPWHLRSSDFDRPNWHARPTSAFELMFEFLRLSPSYELARKYAMEGLTAEERATLPADFKQVWATYKLLGNVQASTFRRWWLARGLNTFGNPFTRPKTHKIGILQGGKQIGISTVGPAVERFLDEIHAEEGLWPSMLLSIPLGRRKGEVLKQVEQLLDRYNEKAVSMPKPKIELMGQRIRKQALFKGIRLLWFRAAKPKWELWRIGAASKHSYTYSRRLDPAAPRKPKDSDEAEDRAMMTKITHRALVKFQAIAENAARGRFPSDMHVEQAEWDFAKLARTIQKRNRIQDREKAILLKQQETSGVDPLRSIKPRPTVKPTEVS